MSRGKVLDRRDKNDISPNLRPRGHKSLESREPVSRGEFRNLKYI